jgi:hypothetical protein
MTLHDLSQLYYLNREIELDQKHIEELRSKAGSVSAPPITDMPRCAGSGDMMERYVAEIVDLSAIIAAKQTECMHERNRLMRYINDIDDSLTRAIFTLRFVYGLPWMQVAASVGGNNTDKSVSKACYRYIENHTEI